MSAETQSPTVENVVAELRALAPKMPEGPWRYEPWHVSEGPPMVYVKEGWLLCGLPADDHAKWIALCSPSNISSLVALIESQRATIERQAEAERAFLAQLGDIEVSGWQSAAHKLKAVLDAAEDNERAAEARVTALEAEKAEKDALLRRMSDALLRIRPLGGSEMFMRVGEEFYADPDVCGSMIENAKANYRRSTTEKFEVRDILRKFLEFADAEYVPNTLFDRARQALSRSSSEVNDGA